MKKSTKAIAMATLATVVFATSAFADVTMDQARKIAFKTAGVSNKAGIKEEKMDYSDHFGKCYEFEFAEGRFKYEVKVVAATGEVVKCEKEKRFF